MRYPRYQGSGQVAWEPRGLWVFWQVRIRTKKHICGYAVSLPPLVSEGTRSGDLKQQGTDGQIYQHATLGSQGRVYGTF